MSRVLLCAAILALTACSVPQTPACEEWVACSDALATANGAVPMEAERYGPEGSCWALPKSAQECAQQCMTKLAEVRARTDGSALLCNPLTPSTPVPYAPLPPPGACSAPRVVEASAGGEIAATDLDGDGTLDLVVGDGPGGTLQTLPNDGTGRFTPANGILDNAANSMHVADVTGDGRPDALLRTRDSISTYSLDAAGRFELAGFTAGFDGAGAHFADVTGDGRLDVLMPRAYVGGLILFGKGKGDGTFEAPIRLQPGDAIAALDTGDVDGDGDPDLVTWRGTGSLAIGRNDGAGNFVFEAVAGSSLKVANRLAVGDLDGDGKLDVAMVGVDVIEPDAVAKLAIAFGNGTGGIAEERVVPLAATGPILRVVDFDEDARADVVVGGADGLAFHRVGADRTVSAPVDTGVTVRANSFAFGDFDGDGRRDVAVTGPGGAQLWGGVTLFFACREP